MGVGVAVHAGAHLGEVVKVVRRAWHQLLAGLADGLATVFRLGLGDLGHMLGDQFAQLAHDLGALGGGRVGPLWKGGLGGGHGSMNLRCAARGDFGQYFLGGGVDGFKTAAAFNALAVDEVVDLLHGVGPCRAVFQAAIRVLVSAPICSISVTTTSPG